MEAEKALTTGKNNDDTDINTSTNNDKDGWVEYQEPLLLDLIAHELNMQSKSSIVDFELNLFDIQKSSLGGMQSEFIHSSRLDNLASCFLALEALVQHCTITATTANNNETSLLIDEDDSISMIALFDHEEIGSSSA